MYRQERAGRTEQDTARTESDSEIQRRTGQPNNDELRSRTERGGRKRMGHEPKERERATTADPPNPIGETIRNGASSSQPQPSLRDWCCRCSLLHTRRMHTAVFWGKRGRVWEGLWGARPTLGLASSVAASASHSRARTGASSQEQDSAVRSSSRGPSEAKGSAADGGGVRWGEKSGRKCWSVRSESGVGFSSITDSLSSLVAHVGESIREEEASESSDAADETCVSVGGRACRLRSGSADDFGGGARPILAVGWRFVRLSEELTVSASSFHQFQNRRVPQELCRHILNINLRHVQSEWSVASASAGQRVGDTRKKRALIDPAGSVPLVGSLVCGRFVNKLDFGFTTHGASELGSFTFGAVRTLGAD
ncbi:hypothetical protein BLNAU_20818 [Blattamonas nauphoetae]|uniref:Uncharacterized protein n=1 Tax=Blattamonas nauphoetae TaxID=2049346 RepID=A0ABQ9WXL3_9EUKA|nr:hypothetical protein BLNAU_20818 [Blattamonas nauphoetae]